MFKTIVNLRVVNNSPLSLDDIKDLEEKLQDLFVSTKAKIIMFKKMNSEEAAEEALLHDLDPEYLNVKIDSVGNVIDLGCYTH